MFQVRAHHDMRHALAEDRRLVALLADDGADVEDDFALFVGFEVEVRDVHPEMTGAKIVGQPAPAFEVEGDLTDALLERHVEGRERLRIDASSRGQPVMLLELAERVFKCRVEASALDR